MGRAEETRPQEESFFSSNYTFYIKDGNEPCNYVGNYKLKPIEYDTFFNCKDHSDAITASIGSINSAKTKNKPSATSYTSVKIHLMKC